jgi:hypothetical protein
MPIVTWSTFGHELTGPPIHTYTHMGVPEWELSGITGRDSLSYRKPSVGNGGQDLHLDRARLHRWLTARIISLSFVTPWRPGSTMR